MRIGKKAIFIMLTIMGVLFLKTTEVSAAPTSDIDITVTTQVTDGKKSVTIATPPAPTVEGGQYYYCVMRNPIPFAPSDFQCDMSFNRPSGPLLDREVTVNNIIGTGMIDEPIPSKAWVSIEELTYMGPDDYRLWSYVIYAIHDAPVGLIGINETFNGECDGQITGVDDTMEYKLSTDQTYTAVSTGEISITGLAPGTYNIRYKAVGYNEYSDMANGYKNISDNASVTIEAGATRTYTISNDVAGGTHTFAKAEYGYGAQPPKTVTIVGTGDSDVTGIVVTLGGANANSFVLSKTTLGTIVADGSDTFTVTPDTGLAVGTYNAIVTVSGSNNVETSFTVSFTVSEKRDKSPSTGDSLPLTGMLVITIVSGMAGVVVLDKKKK